jgi:tryptophan synthase alpha chain
VKTLETHLRALRDSGAKALVPYFVAGATPDWAHHVEAAALAGANAIEIGIPFSDPMMDGVVIQEAALRSLNAGTTLDSLCAELSGLDSDVPLIAMTYYNIFHHYGLERSAGKLVSSGFQGVIVPDLPVEEAGEWCQACDDVDLATVFLVAPSTPPERVAKVALASEGFVYASARMAVTGQASDLGDASMVVAMIREVTDTPAYVGIGITTPDQARATAHLADGAIVGSALVRLILDGATVHDVETFIAAFRHAIDRN